MTKVNNPYRMMNYIVISELSKIHLELVKEYKNAPWQCKDIPWRFSIFRGKFSKSIVTKLVPAKQRLW